MAGVSGVVAALRERLPEHTFVESTELEPGEAPMAVVFVVSAAAHLTESDCALLDAAAEHTDVVIGVVSKIDVHRTWRDVLSANRDTLAAHAPRYAQVPWVGVAAAPDLGEPRIDDLVDTVAGNSPTRYRAAKQVAGVGIPASDRRATVRPRRRGRRPAGTGRGIARRAQHGLAAAAAVRKSERTITLRGQIQQARVQLSHFARNRCSSVRSELQEEAAGLSRRKMPDFEAHTRGRLTRWSPRSAKAPPHTRRRRAGDGCAGDPADAGEAADRRRPASAAEIAAAETWLMMLLGVGFGLGVALTLSRLMSGLASRLSSGCHSGRRGVRGDRTGGHVLVVNIRGLLHDRALLDRWAGDVTSSLRSVVEELVATRVLVAESVLSTALMARDEAENAQVADQVSAIDGELREHAIASARAAAVRDREMPTLQAALDAVRAELGEPGIPQRPRPCRG